MRAFLLLAVAATVAAPAFAQNDNMTTVTAPHGRSSAVSVNDLDLASAAGQRQLDLRLWRAARDVCSFTALRDLSESRLVDRCRSDALARVNARKASSLAD
jgi:UrcA family protein